jgi:hypothetical protein
VPENPERMPVSGRASVSVSRRADDTRVARSFKGFPLDQEQPGYGRGHGSHNDQHGDEHRSKRLI